MAVDPDSSDLMAVLDKMDNPQGFTLKALRDNAEGRLHEWLSSRKSRRVIPIRLARVGYVPVRNPAQVDGMWGSRLNRKVIYAKAGLSLQEQLEVARQHGYMRAEGEQ